MKFRLPKTILCLLAIGLAGNLGAATWTGAGANASWATSGNWTGTAPDNTTPQAIVFDNTSTLQLTQTLDASYSITGITLTNPTGAVTINNGTGTNTLTIGAGGIDMSTATQNLTLGSRLTIGANQTWDIAGGRTLTGPGSTVNGTGNINIVRTSGSGVAAVLLNTAGNSNIWSGYSGSITVNSNVKVQSQGQGAGSFGTGTLTLNGGTVSQVSGSWGWNNTIEVTANSSIENDSSNGLGRALKLTGNITSANGSGLTFTNNTTGGTRSDDSGFVLAGANPSTYGTTTISANSRVRVGGNSTQSLLISGALDAGTRGSLGSGAVSLVASTSELAFTRTDAHTVANDITGLGTVQIGGSTTAMAGTSTQVVTFTGTNTYTGATTIKNGTLSVANLGTSLGGTSKLVIGLEGATSGTLIYTGVGETFNKGIEMDGNATLAANNTSGTLALTGTFTNTNGTAPTANLNLQGSGNASMSSVIADNTSTRTTTIIKSGDGTWTLSGDNTYTSGTRLDGGTLKAGSASAFGDKTKASSVVTVNGGTLDLNGQGIGNKIVLAGGSLINASAYTGTLAGTSGSFDAGTSSAKSYTVDVAGLTLTTLSGQGTFSGGLVTVTGTHNPGNSPGTQTFANGLAYTNGAIVNLEISANGSLADSLIVQNGLNITGTVTLNVGLFGAADYSTAFWDSNQSFKLIDVQSGGTTGTFATLTNNLGGGAEGSWLITQDSTGVTASWTANAIPEPSSLGLLGVGMAGMLLRRRRKQA